MGVEGGGRAGPSESVDDNLIQTAKQATACNSVTKMELSNRKLWTPAQMCFPERGGSVHKEQSRTWS